MELKLPPNGEMKTQGGRKTLGSTRRGTESDRKLRLGRRFSTSKVLGGTHRAHMGHTRGTHGVGTGKSRNYF